MKATLCHSVAILIDRVLEVLVSDFEPRELPQLLGELVTQPCPFQYYISLLLIAAYFFPSSSQSLVPTLGDIADLVKSKGKSVQS